jgi:hypothetical protein
VEELVEWDVVLDRIDKVHLNQEENQRSTG